MKKLVLVLLTVSALTAFLLSFTDSHRTPVTAFLDALDSQQLKKTQFPFEHLSRDAWHFLPAKSWKRDGIQLHELTEKQQELFAEMLRSFLSKTGYDKTQRIMDLENVLAEIEQRPEFRDPTLYHIAVYGNPRSDSLWAWSFEGHHISLNFTILNGKISSSPRFLGANPATIPQGPRKGERTLAEEEDLGYALMHSMDEAQQQQAIFQHRAFKEVVTSNSTQVGPLETVGIAVNELNEAQQTQVKSLLDLYLSTLPTSLASARAQKIQQEEFEDIYFAWAGSLNRKEGHYYRIQGKSFLIEFDNTQNNVNHIHTVWRDFNGDFGRDLIREHYQHAGQHHKH